MSGTIALAIALAPAAWPHDAIDPVCGMVVDADNPPAKSEHGGVTYYFCNVADREAFDADPKRYLAALSARRIEGDARLSASVTPEAPRAGDLVRVVISIEQPGEDMGPPAPLEHAEATLYFVDRLAPTRGPPVALHALPEGSWAAQRTLDRAGEWRVWVRGARGEERLEAIFAIPVEGAGPKDPPLEPLGPGEPVSMTEQHASMRRMGASWTRLGAAIERGTPREAREHLTRVERDATRIQGFALHYHVGDKAELEALGRSFESALANLARDVAAGARDPARERYRTIERDHCTRCHLKFRWALTGDIRAWPDVRPAGLEADVASREAEHTPTRGAR